MKLTDSILNKSHQLVTFGDKAQTEMLKGAEILYNAVKSTMGPSGHNVVIDNGINPPFITKDGVTVAKSINLKAKLPSIGVELIKEVASKTNDLSGDGTTTSTVLAYNLFYHGHKMAATGRNTIALKRGIDWAAKKTIEIIKEMAIPVRNDKDIVSVGTISANGDREIGELLCEAIKKVGEDGIITVEKAKSIQTSLEVSEGLSVESGYVSHFFITNQEKLSCELEKPFILITNKKISSEEEILPALQIAHESNRPLLIIADEIEQTALHMLLTNKMHGAVISCAIKAPSYGENRADILHDIATVTGATCFDAAQAVGLSKLKAEHLGSCEKVIVGKQQTTIIGLGPNVAKEEVQKRIDEIKSALSNPTANMDDLKRNNMRKRLAKLAGGVAIIKVGGATEVEIIEKKDRVDDALNATQAAVQEGILPGGGVALFYAAQILKQLIQDNEDLLAEDEQFGARIVVEMCQSPLKVIVENTGKSSEVVMNELLRTKQSNRWGYDAHKHIYCDLIDAGIIDPHKVERVSVEHACSVIGLMLTCNCVIQTPEQDEVEKS
jgi:chaperonin GroEL